MHTLDVSSTQVPKLVLFCVFLVFEWFRTTGIDKWNLIFFFFFFTSILDLKYPIPEMEFIFDPTLIGKQ